MNHLDGSLSSADGTEIYWQSWQCPEPVACVLVSHGLGEHGGRYAPIAERLVQQGCNVFAIDHRGHGKSGGRRGLIDHFTRCIDDVDLLVEQQLIPAGRPVIVFGHSMGGAIATAYAIKHQQKLAALMLSGAALSADLVPGPMKLICAGLGKLAPRLPVLKIDPSAVSRDPEQVALYANDPLNLSGHVPVRTIAEMVATIAGLPSRFPQLRLPMLVMHGSDDQLIPASASEYLFEHCGSEDKTLKIYDGLYHEILNELPDDREQVMDDILEWVSARFPEGALPAGTLPEGT
ncbi:alpha/beta hydrolase [Spongiibacter sp. KMU-166]|uniref:Alpha/beta hydrolase n=1 Tax=Spongiibacter thalassae TaxID=2721624 RepID=A0ABX1GLM1_9GAMM|nr:alpha/beta hydrolase [Spongiibacter thalassae]NKI19293.1 alpha/beta hydrolase [Spongiibacter thalassae]